MAKRLGNRLSATAILLEDSFARPMKKKPSHKSKAQLKDVPEPEPVKRFLQKTGMVFLAVLFVTGMFEYWFPVFAIEAPRYVGDPGWIIANPFRDESAESSGARYIRSMSSERCMIRIGEVELFGRQPKEVCDKLETSYVGECTAINRRKKFSGTEIFYRCASGTDKQVFTDFRIEIKPVGDSWRITGLEQLR